MKIDSLLGLYLYQHKKLNLPGIGTFEADQSTIVPEDNDKHHTPVQGITFKQHSNPEPDDSLIDFIKTHTGKMKPLAVSDLESYLMLVKQFLNIGKPFYIEGIGTLQKITDGTLQFTPGDYSSARLETPESSNAGRRKAADENKKNDAGESRGTGRKAMILLATVATLAVIGWGGYYFYKMNAANDNQETLPANSVTPMPVPDTSHSAAPILPDSSMLVDTATKAAVRTDTIISLRSDTSVSKPVKPARTIKRIKPLTTADSIPSKATDTNPSSN